MAYFYHTVLSKGIFLFVSSVVSKFTVVMDLKVYTKMLYIKYKDTHKSQLSVMITVAQDSGTC